MSNIEQLKKVLLEEVMPEVEAEIKALGSAKQNKQTKDELEYINGVKKYFDEVLLDIKNNTISQNDALDILESLEEMKVENEEL